MSTLNFNCIFCSKPIIRSVFLHQNRVAVEALWIIGINVGLTERFNTSMEYLDLNVIIDLLVALLKDVSVLECALARLG